jgi:hypothetical protein
VEPHDAWVAWRARSKYGKADVDRRMLNLTCIVHALTSSGPDVKKYCNCSALYPCTMILSRALQQRTFGTRTFFRVIQDCSEGRKATAKVPCEE